MVSQPYPKYLATDPFSEAAERSWITRESAGTLSVKRKHSVADLRSENAPQSSIYRCSFRLDVISNLPCCVRCLHPRYLLFCHCFRQEEEGAAQGETCQKEGRGEESC